MLQEDGMAQAEAQESEASQTHRQVAHARRRFAWAFAQCPRGALVAIEDIGLRSLLNVDSVEASFDPQTFRSLAGARAARQRSGARDCGTHAKLTASDAPCGQLARGGWRP